MTTKIMLYTPVHGPPDVASVSLGYHFATMQLAKSLDVEILDSRIFTDCDLVRARSRAVRVFLESGSASHLLHWDADVVGNATDVRTALDAMLASGHDVVGAPYPRKRVRWERAAAAVCTEIPGTAAKDVALAMQSAAYDYPYGFDRARIGEDVVVTNGCLPVDWMGFGFMLSSRACLERMWRHYAPTLSYGDAVDGMLSWTVGLFQLLMPPQNATPPYAVGPLLSEDYSFCKRWRDIGGEVQMYIGAGSPLNHIGPHVFRGLREGVVMGETG
jgi:hypothetical protein